MGQVLFHVGLTFDIFHFIKHSSFYQALKA